MQMTADWRKAKQFDSFQTAAKVVIALEILTDMSYVVTNCGATDECQVCEYTNGDYGLYFVDIR